MRKQLVTIALALLVGVVGFAAAGVAVAANNEKPPSPPGQGECEHGNSGKPCRDDPQPEKGKDCEEHGQQGGVNEDHCKGEDTTTIDTTTTDTTTESTTESTTTESSTTESSTTESSTTESSTTDSTTTDSPTFLGTPPVAAPAKEKDAVLGATADAPKPTRQPQEAPFTL